MSRRIGVFGGSFDPVHRAHVALAEAARDQLSLRRVFFLPADVPPHKQDRRLCSGRHRSAMIRLALRDRPGLAVCELELELKGVRYTVDTLETIQRRHPDWQLFLLIGEDAYGSLPSWREPERIRSLADLVVCPRPGFSAHTRAGTPGVHWLDGVAIDVSSRGLRRALARGEEPEDLPEAVAQYIRRHALYREDPA